MRESNDRDYELWYWKSGTIVFGLAYFALAVFMGYLKATGRLQLP